VDDPTLFSKSSLLVALIAATAVTASIGCSNNCPHRKTVPPDGLQIYSVAADGASDARPLNVTGIGLARGPDGRIAFLQGNRVAVMNDDGSRLHLLVRADRGSEDPVAPVWSPDGRRIAVGRGHGCDPFEECQSWSISTVDEASGRRRAVIAFGKEPSWAPDGRILAYEGGSANGDRHSKVPFGVFVARPDGRGRREIARGGFPAWSARGLIAFYSLGRSGGHLGLHVIRRDGVKERAIARTEPAFAWSPDGTKLAFITSAFAESLDVVSVASGRRHRVGAAYLADPDGIAWSPDGSKLAWVTYDYRRDEHRLLIAPVTGSMKPLVLARTRKRERIWTPVFTADGRRVLYSVWPL
jgi:Tol biopolymer transport system component